MTSIDFEFILVSEPSVLVVLRENFPSIRLGNPVRETNSRTNGDHNDNEPVVLYYRVAVISVVPTVSRSQ